jgi:hypothetical protein
MCGGNWWRWRQRGGTWWFRVGGNRSRSSRAFEWYHYQRATATFEAVASILLDDSIFFFFGKIGFFFEAEWLPGGTDEDGDKGGGLGDSEWVAIDPEARGLSIGTKINEPLPLLRLWRCILVGCWFFGFFLEKLWVYWE